MTEDESLVAYLQGAVEAIRARNLPSDDGSADVAAQVAARISGLRWSLASLVASGQASSEQAGTIQNLQTAIDLLEEADRSGTAWADSLSQRISISVVAVIGQVTG